MLLFVLPLLLISSTTLCSWKACFGRCGDEINQLTQVCIFNFTKEVSTPEIQPTSENLIKAINDNNIALFKSLIIKEDADVNSRNKSGHSAFTYAAYKGNLEAVRVLINNNIEEIITDEFESSALEYAKKRAFTENNTNYNAIISLLQYKSVTIK